MPGSPPRRFRTPAMPVPVVTLLQLLAFATLASAAPTPLADYPTDGENDLSAGGGGKCRCALRWPIFRDLVAASISSLPTLTRTQLCARVADITMIRTTACPSSRAPRAPSATMTSTRVATPTRPRVTMLASSEDTTAWTTTMRDTFWRIGSAAAAQSLRISVRARPIFSRVDSVCQTRDRSHRADCVCAATSLCACSPAGAARQPRPVARDGGGGVRLRQRQ